MYYETYDHRHGLRSVPAAERMGVENLLDSISSPVGKITTKEIVEPIKDGLKSLGWSGKVAIGGGTNISIASVHGDVGITVQFGNISRIYADLMKFQALFIEEKIGSAIIIVPHKDIIPRLSKTGGLDNRCSYERVSREMPVFSKVITVPVIVYGIFMEDE